MTHKSEITPSTLPLFCNPLPSKTLLLPCVWLRTIQLYCFFTERQKYLQKRQTTFINSSIRFAINSLPIELVNSWPHLGHVISSDIDEYDKSDIERCHSKFVAQINGVSKINSFGRTDANIKTKMLKKLFFSLYDCELWDLCHADIERVCKYGGWDFVVREDYRNTE